ncbi:hypothetical protein PR048_007343 [Dryococelus australis]|uniref:Uncharacterized protein n=1 Tax=Dryococelus australis TaxID=614101 RepID=A0ABQ9IDD4_9NEOP|nr:hypothetical protein PR048_007343 [Dryococelus australis]
MEGNVIKLSSESNWKTWKFQTGVTDDYERTLKEWQQKDFLAQDLIVTQLNEGPMTHVLTRESAEEIWKKLLTVFERKSVSFRYTCYNRSESMSEFLSRVENAVSNLKQLGEKLSETMIITTIFMALPSIYAHFVSTWDSVLVDGWNTGNLIARLLMEEERVLSAKEEDSTAFSVARKFNPIKKCLESGKTGHLAAQYFRLGLGKNSIRSDFFNKLGQIKRDSSEHLCCHKELFPSYHTLNTDRLVTFGYGRVLKAEGIVIGSALDKGYTIVSNNHVSKILNSKVHMNELLPLWVKNKSFSLDMKEWLTRTYNRCKEY